MKHLKRFNESQSMSPIPTVKEFLSKNIDYVLENDCKEDVENAMIEFAKLHVEMALKAASEDANMDDDYYQSLQVYPLTNIK
jgi:hypothetical protein